MCYAVTPSFDDDDDGDDDDDDDDADEFSSVQFSSRRYLCARDGPYALEQPLSLRSFPKVAL